VTEVFKAPAIAQVGADPFVRNATEVVAPGVIDRVTYPTYVFVLELDSVPATTAKVGTSMFSCPWLAAVVVVTASVVVPAAVDVTVGWGVVVGATEVVLMIELADVVAADVV